MDPNHLSSFNDMVIIQGVQTFYISFFVGSHHLIQLFPILLNSISFCCQRILLLKHGTFQGAVGYPVFVAMDCLGLALEWENDQTLRSRMRDEKKLLVYPHDEAYCRPNRVNAVTNSLVLAPVLKRLGQEKKHRLPHLDDLIQEVTNVYQKCGLSTGDRAPYKCSVEIKKLTGFVKRRTQRKEITKDISYVAKNLLQIGFSTLKVLTP